MINILIVDDSEVERNILKNIFQSDKEINVIGFASNGKEAIDLNEKLKPDLITMDIHMPFMDGIEAIKHIMSHQPTPIVVISSTLNNKELNTTYRSLDAGALCVLEKPVNINSPQFDTYITRVTQTIRAMAEVKVIKRRFHVSTLKSKPILPKEYSHRDYQIIAIGTSVGGPQVLNKILADLPDQFPIPIVIVQHMTVGFMEGFVKWLDDHIPLKVKMAEDQEILRGGIIYFAPDHQHLEIIRKGPEQLSVQLTQGKPVSGFCPSATVLLNSVAKACDNNAIGMLLTGMGNDGAKGLLAIKHAGGHTIIQDPSSAVVFGMAGVAQSLGAVDKIVELEQISHYLKLLAPPH